MVRHITARRVGLSCSFAIRGFLEFGYDLLCWLGISRVSNIIVHCPASITGSPTLQATTRLCSKLRYPWRTGPVNYLRLRFHPALPRSSFTLLTYAAFLLQYNSRSRLRRPYGCTGSIFRTSRLPFLSIEIIITT